MPDNAFADVIALNGDHIGPQGAGLELSEGQLELIPAAPAEPEPDDRLRSLSVSNIVQLARCPKQFYWTVVRPLPRRPSPAARLGQELHRWIEIRSIGQGTLDEIEDPPVPEEPTFAGLKATFESSPYATLAPRFTEQRFVIAIDEGYLVRGRIDAVYVHDDSSWELVDFKTGREPNPGDGLTALQLSIYAMAAQQLWGMSPEELKVTYFYLATGRAASVAATDLELTREWLVDAFRRVETGAFEPRPGRLCYSCDFLERCAAGRAHLRRH